ncbi:MAG: phage portal protein [Litorimonas sp.]
MAERGLKAHAGERGEPRKTPMVFSFGDPDPSLGDTRLLGYVVPSFAGYYDPPVPFQGIADTLRASVHHASSLKVKRNLLVKTFVPHRLLSRADFSRFAYEFLTFGNGYLERKESMLRTAVRLAPAPAKYMRRHKDGHLGMISPSGTVHDFAADAVFHLLEPDVDQEVYGLPDYLAALQPIWLNESATLFRRKYYKNGAHAGYIAYLTDDQFTEADVEALQEQITASKGPGNFRSLFMHAPGGKPDGLKIIHLSEATAKDEFSNVKNISRDDVLAAHRVPPQLIGVVPVNAGGFGSITDALQVFERNEIAPLQRRMEELNQWIGEEVMRFLPFDWEEAQARGVGAVVP